MSIPFDFGILPEVRLICRNLACQGVLVLGQHLCLQHIAVKEVLVEQREGEGLT